MISIENKSHVSSPLDRIAVKSDKSGILSVRDGAGREYFRGKINRNKSFRISGSVGGHNVSLVGNDGRIISSASFKVECRTYVKDRSGKYARLLEMLKYTMTSWSEGSTTIKLGHKFYKYYVCWLRDHVHTLKGMKYFDNGDLKTGIELYADYRRKDGMIWDRIEKYGSYTTWRDMTFSYGDFVMKVDKDWRFERIPVENDVEYLFVEGLYYTWKATGDDEWMKGILDKAVKALSYSMKDPYRWSRKYGLLKRGYTIDTWDFMSEYDNVHKSGPMCIDKKHTRFGIMHGDNTGFAMSCEYLAEMLSRSGRGKEAEKFLKVGKDTRRHLNKISWNKKFFTHHVPEDRSFKRDLGVDESKQVSLSNAYALNRGISEEQCSGIIESYQKIRKEMPAGSPGEFYQIYPPFEKGFGSHNGKWEYMNGGVTTIVAGELAHGAFENGYEKYGVDILDRMIGWGENHEGYFPCCLRGDRVPDNSSAKFAEIDLRSVANTDFKGTDEKKPNPVGWLNEGANDLSEMPVGKRKFQDVPFAVIEPSKNEGRACIGLSTKPLYQKEVSLKIGKNAESIYFLHACSGSHSISGWATLEYSDGEKYVQYMERNRQIGSWFMPSDSVFSGGMKNFISPDLRVAWRGRNQKFDNVGVYVYGMKNPHPEKTIGKITLTASETGNVWLVLGITLSDSPAAMPRTDVSFGIPDNWGAGAVVYALAEGLVGIKDTGVSFDKVKISPRWTAAGTDRAEACITYPASGGYAAYEYTLDKEGIRILSASSAQESEFQIMVPENRPPGKLSVDSVEMKYKIRRIGKSVYACFALNGISAKAIRLELEKT